MPTHRIPLQSPLAFIGLALALTATGLVFIFSGFYFAADSIWRVVLHAFGGAVISLGWVEVLHEWSVARKVRAEFMVLGDFIEKGIERVCTGEEIADLGRAELSQSRSLKVIGIGISWLLKGANRERLSNMLSDGHPIQVLIPDPLSREIIERYSTDEPADFELGLPGLAGRVHDWNALAKKHTSLKVRIYDRYPVANVTILDDHVYVAPVLFKRRAKDNLTAIFRRPSKGAAAYEDHFDKVFTQGAAEITREYLELLTQSFPQTTVTTHQPERIQPASA